ncbi:MAG: AmmeMemoRadiSam system protein B [Desulfomonilia bacterium]
MKYPPAWILLPVALLSFVVFCGAPLQAKTIRNPVAAGMFYPSSQEELRSLIEYFSAQARSTPIDIPSKGRLRALILPHAGYVYSGFTASHASRVVDAGSYSRVLILAPDHRVGFSGAHLSSVDAYRTPLGDIILDEGCNILRSQHTLFKSRDASDRLEHSVEVILPFLQVYLEKFTLIPVVLGSCSPGAVERSIEELMTERTLLVVSTDLSHYLPYQDAVTRDRETIRRIMEMDIEGLSRDSNRACGVIPVQVLLTLAREKGWRPVFLHYSTSGDTAGTKDRVVGYAAIAFYGGCSMRKELSAEQGRALVTLARKTLEERLRKGSTPSSGTSDALGDEALQEKKGTFVTLTIGDRLRGCIGSLEPRESILDGVRHNAVNAAFHDPRFKPLSQGELEQVHIEVSILTEPTPLSYTDSHDLLTKLRPGVDGVIIKYGYASATFLPQVWDQLPTKEEFLSNLCMKAGLSSDAWRREKLDVFTYQVQYFEEE